VSSSRVRREHDQSRNVHHDKRFVSRDHLDFIHVLPSAAAVLQGPSARRPHDGGQSHPSALL